MVIVFGTERPFIELFGNVDPKTLYEKKYQSWVADVETSQIKHADPNCAG